MAYKGKKNETVLRASGEMLLMDLLLEKMGGMSKTSIKHLLSRRVVRVNGKIESRADVSLQAGDEVVIVPEHGQRSLRHPKLRVVYEDDYLIVVEKEVGLLTVAAHPGSSETTCFSILRDYVKQAHKQNQVFVVHRLDRETSGLLVFAKSKELQEYMRAYWHELVKKRTYVAVVEGEVEQEAGTVHTWLSQDPQTTMVYSSPVDDGGKEAITHYRRVKTNGEYSLLELNLETGRTNQIRVHMASIGHPVVSDRKYGSGKVPPIDRLGLHARILEFIHPATEEVVHFETPVPRAFLHIFHE